MHRFQKEESEIKYTYSESKYGTWNNASNVDYNGKLLKLSINR